METDSKTVTPSEVEPLADRIEVRAFEINKSRGVSPCPEIVTVSGGA